MHRRENIGARKIYFPDGKVFRGRGVFACEGPRDGRRLCQLEARRKNHFGDENIFNGISHAGLGKNLASDSASEWKHGTARKNLAGRLEKKFPDEKVLLGRYALGNRQGGHCIGVKTSGPENNPPAAGSAETSIPRWKCSMGFPMIMMDLEKIGYSSGNMGGSEKNRPGRRSAQKKSSPMKRFYAFGLGKKTEGDNVSE